MDMGKAFQTEEMEPALDEEGEGKAAPLCPGLQPGFCVLKAFSHSAWEGHLSHQLPSPLETTGYIQLVSGSAPGLG
jgi:hypothetical protein